MHKNAQDVYNEHQKAKQKRGKTKKYSFHQQKANQSIKSTKSIVPALIYTLTHRDRLFKKSLMIFDLTSPHFQNSSVSFLPDSPENT